MYHYLTHLCSSTQYKCLSSPLHPGVPIRVYNKFLILKIVWCEHSIASDTVDCFLCSTLFDCFLCSTPFSPASQTAQLYLFLTLFSLFLEHLSAFHCILFYPVICYKLINCLIKTICMNLWPRVIFYYIVSVYQGMSPLIFLLTQHSHLMVHRNLNLACLKLMPYSHLNVS